MQQHDITFNFKARYYKLDSSTGETRQIWFVLHGYGQLAQYFIKKFTALTAHHICVIAPEGLSRFYLENFQAGMGRTNDRVGATWMTKENRLADIGNYITYLNHIYDHEVKDTGTPITVLGFSQGSATASRWVTHGPIRFNRLILWAGLFPPDMNIEPSAALLKNKETILVYGKHDPFLSDARFAEMKLVTDKLQVPVKEVPFDGDHDIHTPTLLRFI